MIDPPDRDELQAQVDVEMKRYDTAHGPAQTRLQRFLRKRHRRLTMRRFSDRHATRHS